MKLSRFLMVGLGVSIVLAVGLSPFASSQPDGLERVAEELEFHDEAAHEPAWQSSPATDYEVPGVEGPVATSVAGLLGTLATFGAAYGVARLLKRSNSTGERE
jgi:cobalt/nickel transport protein